MSILLSLQVFSTSCVDQMPIISLPNLINLISWFKHTPCFEANDTRRDKYWCLQIRRLLDISKFYFDLKEWKRNFKSHLRYVNKRNRIPRQLFTAPNLSQIRTNCFARICGKFIWTVNDPNLQRVNTKLVFHMTRNLRIYIKVKNCNDL